MMKWLAYFLIVANAAVSVARWIQRGHGSEPLWLGVAHDVLMIASLTLVFVMAKRAAKPR